jgi:hypothetical protein
MTKKDKGVIPAEAGIHEGIVGADPFGFEGRTICYLL